MSYPIIICEDNPIELKHINTLIENCLLFHENFFQIECSTNTPQNVIKYINESLPTHGTYLLDIDLQSSIDGIDLAKKIREVDVQANIVFTTTHDELAPETLKRKVGAIGFIEKGQIMENYRDDIYGTLEYIKRLIEKSKEYQQKNFTFVIGTQMYNFNQNEVYSITSSQIPHQLIFLSEHGQYEFYGKLKDLEQKYSFLFRINRSCLINPINIRKIDFPSRRITLKNGIIDKFSIGKATKLKKILLSIN
ncbi:LytR/AlgR family response regulator transcription factor [Companilactobacillus huachuanensis]|uniref:LytR/AlgR family response regulator transcription factor n=1 Tax=Companilactobacillus huachuanensis TaxID=2559914 RepID=A0ABW1RMZ0_9LACO|nr:LytTR family transcriptional regulator DNA-binding domain-containing protein [Companilactobacillus huachuanensis]